MKLPTIEKFDSTKHGAAGPCPWQMTAQQVRPGTKPCSIEFVVVDPSASKVTSYSGRIWRLNWKATRDCAPPCWCNWPERCYSRQPCRPRELPFGSPRCAVFAGRGVEAGTGIAVRCRAGFVLQHKYRGPKPQKKVVPFVLRQ